VVGDVLHGVLLVEVMFNESFGLPDRNMA